MSLTRGNLAFFSKSSQKYFNNLRCRSTTSIYTHMLGSSRTITMTRVSPAMNSYNKGDKENNKSQDHDYHSQNLHPDPEIAKIIHKYANQKQTSASLETLMRTGRGEYLHKTYNDISEEEATNTSNHEDKAVATERVLTQVAGFLNHELPIRLAHRVRDLSNVPYMKDMKSVQQVKELYSSSVLDLVQFEETHGGIIKNASAEEEFARLLEGIYERHASVLVQMARGAFELRAAITNGSISIAKDENMNGSNGAESLHSVNGNQKNMRKKGPISSKFVEFDQLENCHAFLDRFYVSRIGIRVLIGQYLSLRQAPVENYIGIICSKTSPYEIVNRAIDDASFMCTRKYGDAPEVNITGRLDLTFPYVPTHLHYIMLELLKNSMRATMDWHNDNNDAYGIGYGDYPPIKVVIADGNENEDVVIKVADEGGGIPRSNMKKIWSYLFTTADPAIQEGMVAFNENVDHSIDSPLAGLGYGLPISRSYARYFGGDLSIMSMEGVSTILLFTNCSIFYHTPYSFIFLVMI